MSLRDEILEQPHTLARLLDEGAADAAAIAADLRRAAPAFVVVAARGSSDNAARYAQYLLGAHARLVVALASPSLHTLYGAPPSLRGGAVLALSQSGQSPDIVAVVEDARRQGVPAVALTNDPASPLARAASHVLALRAGEERSVAATKSYTAELVGLAMIAAALHGDDERRAALASVPDMVAAALAGNPSLDDAATTCAHAERLAVLGRGFNNATAHEIALKVKETCTLAAEASSWADFEHGPMALVEPGFPVLVVAPSGATRAGAQELVDRLAARGADVLVLSDDAALYPALRMPPVAEWLSPAVAIVPGQLWALALARARGVDPEAPRHISKVTRTR